MTTLDNEMQGFWVLGRVSSCLGRQIFAIHCEIFLCLPECFRLACQFFFGILLLTEQQVIMLYIRRPFIEICTHSKRSIRPQGIGRNIPLFVEFCAPNVFQGIPCLFCPFPCYAGFVIIQP